MRPPPRTASCSSSPVPGCEPGPRSTQHSLRLSQLSECSPGHSASKYSRGGRFFRGWSAGLPLAPAGRGGTAATLAIMGPRGRQRGEVNLVPMPHPSLRRRLSAASISLNSSR